MAPPSIPVAWNLTGGALPNGSAPDAVDYWRRHMREPVRFADGVRGLYDDGFRIFLEVGPHPTLLALAQQSLPEEDSLFLSSMRRGRDDWNELLTSLADLHVHGVPVDFAGFDRPYARRRVALPTYPFERERFWARLGCDPGLKLDDKTAARGERGHETNGSLPQDCLEARANSSISGDGSGSSPKGRVAAGSCWRIDGDWAGVARASEARRDGTAVIDPERVADRYSVVALDRMASRMGKSTSSGGASDFEVACDIRRTSSISGRPRRPAHRRAAGLAVQGSFQSPEIRREANNGQVWLVTKRRRRRSGLRRCHMSRSSRIMGPRPTFALNVRHWGGLSTSIPRPAMEPMRSP